MWEFDDLLDEVDKIYNKNGSNKQVNGAKSNLNTSSSVIIDKSKKENLQPQNDSKSPPINGKLLKKDSSITDSDNWIIGDKSKTQQKKIIEVQYNVLFLNQYS